LIEIEDHIDAPEEELKRAEHLIYVSLKITRTCGIMKNAIKRLIDAYELGFTEILEALYNSGQIEKVPNSIKEKSEKVKELVSDVNFTKYMRHYNLLKRIDASTCENISEFRKGVTLKVLSGRLVEVKIDTLYEYLEITKEGVKFIRNWISKNV